MNDFLTLLLEFKVKRRGIVKLFFGSKLKSKKKYRSYFFTLTVKPK